MSDDGKFENIIYEIRETRKDVKKIWDTLHDIDKKVFANKTRLSFFIAGASFACSMLSAVIISWIKTSFFK